MNLARIDLNLFVIFEIIYREQSLTRAAKRLHLSQPAVSHALARLREQCNDPLFERAGSGMAPTPLAKAMIGPVRAALAQLEATLQPATDFDPSQSHRRFVLATRDLIENTTLPRLMARLGSDAPNMQIHSQRVARKELAQALQHGKVDLAIDVLLPMNASIEQQKILSDSLVVIARQTGATRAPILSLESYVRAQHVQVSSRPEGLGVEDFALSKLGHSRQVRLRCQNYQAAVAVVQQSDLLLTLPASYAKGLSGVHVQPLPLMLEPIELYLYWPRKASADPALMWLKEQLLALVNG